MNCCLLAMAFAFQSVSDTASALRKRTRDAEASAVGNGTTNNGQLARDPWAWGMDQGSGQHASPWDVLKGASAVGQGVANAAGSAVNKGTSDVVKGASNIGSTISQGVVNAGSTVGKSVSDVRSAIGQGAADAGSAAEKGTPDVTQGPSPIGQGVANLGSAFNKGASAEGASDKKSTVDRGVANVGSAVGKSVSDIGGPAAADPANSQGATKPRSAVPDIVPGSSANNPVVANSESVASKSPSDSAHEISDGVSASNQTATKFGSTPSQGASDRTQGTPDGVSAHSKDVAKSRSPWDIFKGVSDVGSVIGDGVTKTGSTISKGASDIAHGAADAGSTIGQSVANPGSAASKGTSDSAQRASDVANAGSATSKGPSADVPGSDVTKPRFPWDLVKGVSDVESAIVQGVANAGSAVSKGASDLVHGASDVGSTIEQGVANSGSATGKGVSDIVKGASDLGSAIGQGVESTVGKGASGIVQDVIDAGKAFGKGQVVGTELSTGLEIAAKLAKSGLDLQKSVVDSIGGLGGTAIDGVITAVSNTTGVKFDPVTASLNSIAGLEDLGQGVDKINGLPLSALRSIREVTQKGMALMSNTNRRPTFFDPGADGIVNVADTQRGFVLLGLSNSYAAIMAYALHSTFSYSTAESWIPNVSTMPIKIDNISKTLWGRNWGNYERMDWVSDAGIARFFGLRPRRSWAEYVIGMVYVLSLVYTIRGVATIAIHSYRKSSFGVALLIFEWGTTWPFAIPHFAGLDKVLTPAVAHLSLIVQAVILPTIAKSRQHARQLIASGEGQQSTSRGGSTS
ncbi:Caleosin domain-containing protein [Mycena sanguinolenta]|uniref:Caleosin domain-containing protein n=1 Tax=Mycena sanguinolenta TaxID=230812 RepID=A0A8H6XHH4_9AGAR|nr:Caleosin domain-containing protein [Mycena sanguinolenta]